MIFNHHRVTASATAFRLTMQAIAGSEAILEISQAGAYGLSTLVWKMSTEGRLEVIYGNLIDGDIDPGKYGAYAASDSIEGWINGSGLYAPTGWLLQAASTEENAEPSKYVRWKPKKTGWIGLQVLMVSI